jgi:hypothetical protein
MLLKLSKESATIINIGAMCKTSGRSPRQALQRVADLLKKFLATG